MLDTVAVRYSTLLLDLDHTLLDTDASEAAAFDHAMRSAGVDEPAAYLPAYHQINRTLWGAVERGEISTADVRTARFEQLVQQVGLAADPLRLADDFVAGLGNHGELYPGARAVLEALAGLPGVRMALLTNGLSEVQRVRVARLELERYFGAIVISSEIGAAKPAPAIYDAAFAMLGGPAKAGALMVGDSLTSDIQGGRNYGIATCWYNPHRRADAAAASLVDYDIATLDALLNVVQA